MNLVCSESICMCKVVLIRVIHVGLPPEAALTATKAAEGGLVTPSNR